MLSATLSVTNSLGLHARAAAQLVKLASGYKSSIALSRPGRNGGADAKSILSILSLAAGCGTELELTVDGDDETAALSAVQSLFTSGFGER
jgi:phosphotransferase system HPr (HPr) family protein